MYSLTGGAGGEGVGRRGRSGPGGKEWAGGKGVGQGEGVGWVRYISLLTRFFIRFFKALSGDGTLPITEALQLLITQRHFGNSFPAIKVSN